MGVKKAVQLLSILFVFIPMLPAQTGIYGHIDLDTTKWAPVVYLSHIPDFDQLHTISYDLIIDSAPLSADGSFLFRTDLLPEKEQFYRIHFSKKGDPPSSLIIGGRDHNHAYLLACKDARIGLTFLPGKNLINGISYRDYPANRALLPIFSMVALLDTLDNFGTSVNRGFLRKATQQELRNYADTCSFALVSLYAIYQSNFLNDLEGNRTYYRRFLRKWRSEETAYFKVFRDEIHTGAGSAGMLLLMAAFLLFVSAYMLVILRRKKRRRMVLSTLSIQERKVFNSIREGKSNKEIADDLAVSLSTIKSHANSIYSKLGVSSRKEIMDI